MYKPSTSQVQACTRLTAHAEALEKLCRVCTSLLPDSNDSKVTVLNAKFKCAHFKKAIEVYLNIVIKPSDPTFMCYSCLDDIRKRMKNPQLCQSTVRKFAKRLWQRACTLDSSCDTCKIYRQHLDAKDKKQNNMDFRALSVKHFGMSSTRNIVPTENVYRLSCGTCCNVVDRFYAMLPCRHRQCSPCLYTYVDDRKRPVYKCSKCCQVFTMCTRQMADPKLSMLYSCECKCQDCGFTGKRLTVEQHSCTSKSASTPPPFKPALPAPLSRTTTASEGTVKKEHRRQQLAKCFSCLLLTFQDPTPYIRESDIADMGNELDETFIGNKQNVCTPPCTCLNLLPNYLEIYGDSVLWNIVNSELIKAKSVLVQELQKELKENPKAAIMIKSFVCGDENIGVIKRHGAYVTFVWTPQSRYYCAFLKTVAECIQYIVSHIEQSGNDYQFGMLLYLLQICNVDMISNPCYTYPKAPNPTKRKDQVHTEWEPEGLAGSKRQKKQVIPTEFSTNSMQSLNSTVLPSTESSVPKNEHSPIVIEPDAGATGAALLPDDVKLENIGEEEFMDYINIMPDLDSIKTELDSEGLELEYIKTESTEGRGGEDEDKHYVRDVACSAFQMEKKEDGQPVDECHEHRDAYDVSTEYVKLEHPEVEDANITIEERTCTTPRIYQADEVYSAAENLLVPNQSIRSNVHQEPHQPRAPLLVECSLNDGRDLPNVQGDDLTADIEPSVRSPSGGEDGEGISDDSQGVHSSASGTVSAGESLTSDNHSLPTEEVMEGDCRDEREIETNDTLVEVQSDRDVITADTGTQEGLVDGNKDNGELSSTDEVECSNLAENETRCISSQDIRSDPESARGEKAPPHCKKDVVNSNLPADRHHSSQCTTVGCSAQAAFQPDDIPRPDEINEAMSKIYERSPSHSLAVFFKHYKSEDIQKHLVSNPTSLLFCAFILNRLNLQTMDKKKLRFVMYMSQNDLLRRADLNCQQLEKLQTVSIGNATYFIQWNESSPFMLNKGGTKLKLAMAKYASSQNFRLLVVVSGVVVGFFERRGSINGNVYFIYHTVRAEYTHDSTLVVMSRTKVFLHEDLSQICKAIQQDILRFTSKANVPSKFCKLQQVLLNKIGDNPNAPCPGVNEDQQLVYMPYSMEGVDIRMIFKQREKRDSVSVDMEKSIFSWLQSANDFWLVSVLAYMARYDRNTLFCLNPCDWKNVLANAYFVLKKSVLTKETLLTFDGVTINQVVMKEWVTAAAFVSLGAFNEQEVQTLMQLLDSRDDVMILFCGQLIGAIKKVQGQYFCYVMKAKNCGHDGGRAELGMASSENVEIIIEILKSSARDLLATMEHGGEVDLKQPVKLCKVFDKSVTTRKPADAHTKAFIHILDTTAQRVGSEMALEHSVQLSADAAMEQMTRDDAGNGETAPQEGNGTADDSECRVVIMLAEDSSIQRMPAHPCARKKITKTRSSQMSIYSPIILTLESDEECLSSGSSSALSSSASGSESHGMKLICQFEIQKMLQIMGGRSAENQNMVTSSLVYGLISMEVARAESRLESEADQSTLTYYMDAVSIAYAFLTNKVTDREKGELAYQAIHIDGYGLSWKWYQCTVCMLHDTQTCLNEAFSYSQYTVLTIDGKAVAYLTYDREALPPVITYHTLRCQDGDDSAATWVLHRQKTLSTANYRELCRFICCDLQTALKDPSRTGRPVLVYAFQGKINNGRHKSGLTLRVQPLAFARY